MILNTLQFTKIESCETPKQGITVVKSTPNQIICSHKSSMIYQIASEMLKIQDLSKTGLTDILGLPQKKKSLPNHTPRFLTASAGEGKLPRILTGIICFSHIFEPKVMNSVWPGFSLNLLADNHFLTSYK